MQYVRLSERYEFKNTGNKLGKDHEYLDQFHLESELS